MSEWKLFVDDKRLPPDTRPMWADKEESDWDVARTAAEVRELCEEKGPPAFVSLDYVMGAGKPNGLDIAEMMIEEGWMPEGHHEGYRVHSKHFKGRRKIIYRLQEWEE